MRLRQRLSIFSAALLPSLALSAYLLTAPVSTYACTWDYGGCPDGYCNDGHSGCTVPVGGWGIFVFCPDQDGYNGTGGPGTCVDTDCVQCQYGD